MHLKKYLLLFIAAGIASCKHEPAKIVTPAPTDNYPENVRQIIVKKCATAGCHNAASYAVSGGGLLMDTWEHMFDGGNTGAAIVPFSPESSPLLYFTNSFEDLGPLPNETMKMPLNNPPLTREEYLTLREWIVQGAPDKNGNIPFASNAASRQKIYLAHQGCDYITVIDAQKNVVMRCVPIGKEVTIEAAYSVKVSPQQDAYISFWASQYILKMNTESDTIVDDIDLGFSNSNVLVSTGNDLLLTNLFTNSLLRVNPSTKQVTHQYGGNLTSPHGIAANKTADTLFVTEQSGNIIYKITNAGVNKLSVDGLPVSNNPSGPNPYNIVMTPDFSKYFVSCPGTNEVRVMDAYADTLIQTIPVGLTPQELVVSRTKPYLFVSCMDEPSLVPTFKGAVYVINYVTYDVVQIVGDRYYMPHALTVDDVNKKLFVFSRNIDPNGPVPHHNSATCSGRNGFYSVYDFENLKPVNNKRYEVTIDPFASDARFH